jgi:multidrug efflux system membrane fusion protein
MSNLPTEAAPARPPSPPPEEHPAGKRRRHPIFWAVLAAAVLGIAFIAYRSRVSSGSQYGGAGRGARGGFGPGMNAAVPVVARPAQKADINVVLNGLGTVTPVATATIRTQISGQLFQVNFTEGQLVKKGDLLAVIDPRPYEAALSQAQGQLLQAQAQLKEAQIDLERYVTLSAQDSISKQQVDAQKALVSQYEGMAKTDQAAVDNAQLNLAYCHISAPFPGRVGFRQIDAGNYVTPGDASGLVVLTQVDPITVIFPQSEDNIPAVVKRLRSGATIQVDAYDRTGSSKLASGTLTTIDNTVDTTTGQFKLRATFPNGDESLFPNQFVVVRMLLDVDRGVTVIPTSAIERGQQGSFVYVVGADNKVAAKVVKLGHTEGERVAVTSGISVGDNVVVDGADRLKDGMVVDAKAPAGRPAGTGTAKPGTADGERKPWRPGGSN